MSEEQLKAAETEATEQAEDGVEEISEEDLKGVAGGTMPYGDGIVVGGSAGLANSGAGGKGGAG